VDLFFAVSVGHSAICSIIADVAQLSGSTEQLAYLAALPKCLLILLVCAKRYHAGGCSLPLHIDIP